LGEALFAGQDQKLSVGGEDFADRILKLAAGVDSPLHLLDPLVRNVLGAFLAVDHEGQRPDGVAGVFGLGAVTGGFPATEVALRKRTGEQIVGDWEGAEELGLALAEVSGLRAAGLGVGAVHLMVSIPLDIQKASEMFGMRK
jgi:hypothetical protein